MKDNRADFKYGTYVYKILEITDGFIRYQTITDFTREHVHFIRFKSTFPYFKLKVDEIYTIVAVQLPNRYDWHFLFAWPLGGVEVIVNEDLQTFLDKKYGKKIEYK